MPGIVGIIGIDSANDKALLLRSMLGCMMHEPFYTSGTYINEKSGVFLGWVNRSCSFSDCMPLWNETHDVCLIYYGEDFTDKGFINNLKTQGHSINTANASYLIRIFEAEEARFLELLNGWFNGVLVDLRKNQVLLFNDRYGLLRIYYHESPEAFYFSSEAKALLKAQPSLRELDQKGLGEYLSFGCVLENRSLFAGVHLLPSASIWKFRTNHVPEKSLYFRPEQWERQSILEKETFYRRFKECFAKILPRYLDVGKTGLSLTGGLDTRMILAWARLSGGDMPCYTFGGMYKDCYDVKISRTVANMCHQTHSVLVVDRLFFSQSPLLAEKAVYITDGNVEITGAADLYLNKMAREIAPIRLTGKYGGEIMRATQYLKHRPSHSGLFVNEFEKHVAAAAETLKIHRQGHPVSLVAFKQVPWFHNNRLALEQSQITMRSPYLDNELVALMYRAPAEVLENSELSLHLINAGNPSLARIMTDRGLGGSRGKLPSILTHLYREFLFKTDYAFDHGMPRSLADVNHYLFAPLCLDKILSGKHKFCHFRVWYRDELSRYVKEVLLDRKSLERPYLNGSVAEKMVFDHTGGRQNYTTEISRLLTIELLQRLIID